MTQQKHSQLCTLVLTQALTLLVVVDAFHFPSRHQNPLFIHTRQQSKQRSHKKSPPLFLSSTSPPSPGGSSTSEEEDAALQWDLFTRHHAKGAWRGTWSTYDYIGDVLDDTTASVILQPEDGANSPSTSNLISQTHEIVMGEIKSDCETCFDSTNVKSFPVAAYQPGALRRQRLASVGMVNGPTVLRSGAMSTELILRHGDGRLRVIFQHAPVWSKDVEAGQGPPDGLKLYRTVVCREALRSLPPTYENEQKNPPQDGDPTFVRGVPPFAWHKKWAGTSWTWGPNRGDEGWQVDEMEEVDAWHGRPRGDNTNTWSMRLPGGVLVQCARMITAAGSSDEDSVSELMRLAWLPENDKLVRVEASVFAMDRPIEDDEGMVIGFAPPTLGSLRVDMMQKVGELEGESLLERQKEVFGEDGDDDDGLFKPEQDQPTGLDAIREAMDNDGEAFQ